MKRPDRRRAHLNIFLSHHSEDVAFIKAVNERLARKAPEENPLSESYLSQLKSGSRNIGNKVARKLEIGLGLNEGALDAPLPDELEAIAADGIDPEFEAVLAAAEPDQVDAALRQFAASISPKDAFAYARIFLDRAGADL